MLLKKSIQCFYFESLKVSMLLINVMTFISFGIKTKKFLENCPFSIAAFGKSKSFSFVKCKMDDRGLNSVVKTEDCVSRVS